MYDLTNPRSWVILTIGLVIGLFLGWLITTLVQRRQNQGQNVTQLRKEMEDYRAEVNQHFAQTADLFKESSEKYRDLYEHLSGGAQKLCNDLPDRTQVEFRPGRLLADPPPASDTTS